MCQRHVPRTVIGICPDCKAWHMGRATLPQVEEWYLAGHIPQKALDAYLYLWCQSPLRKELTAEVNHHRPQDTATGIWADAIQAYARIWMSERSNGA